MASLGLPHWLMIGGVVLVLLGFAGLAWSRHAQVEADYVSLPSDIDSKELPAAEDTEGVKAEGDGIQANTTRRAMGVREKSGTELGHRA